MTDTPISAEEFSRLMSLPEDDPQRMRAATTPRFEAMRRMLADFERPGAAPTDPEDIDSACVELRRRLAGQGIQPTEEPSPPDPARPGPPRAADRPEAGWRALADLLGRPAGRAGVALAGLAVVAGLAWWSSGIRPPVRAVRGTDEVADFRVASTRDAAGTVMLRWTRVPGADEYRVRFLGADLTEIARLEGLGRPECALRAGGLPRGLAAGAEVSIEVVALHQGDPIATSSAQWVRLP